MSYNRKFYTLLLSKDNEAARRRRRRRIFKYVEEADDDANKVSQRKRKSILEGQFVIYFRNVSLSFLDKKLFDNINWTIHPKSRIGLVGDNGTGKTTLFRAILEQVHLDSGIIDIPNRKQKTIGYLPQDLVELESIPLIEFLKKKSGIAAARRIHKRSGTPNLSGQTKYT